MVQPKRQSRRQPAFAAITLALAVAIAAVSVQKAAALRFGGEGNKPLDDPGWPKGAAAVFNTKARIAWWQRDGGEWNSECRGDAKAFNAVLSDFAKVEVKTKRVIVHNGVGSSYWLNPGREPAKQDAAKVDWVFVVYEPADWERWHKILEKLNPADAVPLPQIDVYTGGNINWADVAVPEGININDQRLEAHGFTPADGTVLEGKVLDLATQKPMAARMRLQRVEPQAKGGYQYPVVAETVADAQGHWVLKKAPAGWQRAVIEADGFVPRVVGYAQFDGQPSWHSYDSGLARPAPVSGRISDEAGQPLADAEVRFDGVVSEPGGGYESPDGYAVKSGADGRFHLDLIPIGRATIWLHKEGYCRPGLGQAITMPAADIALNMKKAARVVATVDFGAHKRPEGYIVHIEPEGGEAVGKWSGSGNINAQNQMEYKDVPPGRYVLYGHPNPSSEKERTEHVTVDLKGGETTELKLTAKPPPPPPPAPEPVEPIKPPRPPKTEGDTF